MSHRVTRRAVLAGGFAALAGCTGGSESSEEGTTETVTTETTTVATETATTTETDPDALPLADSQLPVAYPFGELDDSMYTVTGEDAIPAIDDPTFLSPEEAEIEADEVVFGIAAGDTVKAYPQSILVWHEIVNDTVAGTPLAVTYCPLTGTTLGFERGSTTFGVSGRLINNNLVMYDRSTSSLWPQVLATAIEGTHKGNSLREHPLSWARFEDWLAAYPETEILSRETGYVRNYDNDPYGSYTPKGGYYTEQDTLYPSLVEDDRFHAKHVVVGARGPDGAVAIDAEAVAEAGVMDAGPYLAVYRPDIDSIIVYRNPDGTEFEADGSSVAGPTDTYQPEALPLQRAMAFDAMWFAWVGFYPETAVYP